ncbi:hypothetical protein [Flavobacterium sp. DSR2-3-3]|uniref:hypothetical protein n=1 Tax=Flavobacterium sp. DSR2-3-3 TaxID=2804632 RepID=UPI003CF8B6DF
MKNILSFNANLFRKNRRERCVLITFSEVVQPTSSKRLSRPFGREGLFEVQDFKICIP